MKTFSNRISIRLNATLFVLLLSFGFAMPKLHAQNYNDNYNNGYNNNDGYNDGYQGNDNYNQGNNNYNNNGDYGGNYSEFYNDLAPYGQWLSDPQYGYVWAPNVGNGFRPYYSNGYWAMTQYGNTWVSNYAWGWAPFHYGRWAQSNYYGWIWIPGNTWGPAWVNWRQGGGYYGWAPMGPGISVSISFGLGYNIPNPWWTFIPCGNIYARDYGRYYSPRQTVNIINNTTIINNTYIDNRSRNTYVTGPRRTEIEAVTKRSVNVYQVNNASSRGASQIKGTSLNVYRPSIGAISRAEQAKIAPAQVKRLDASTVSNTGGGRAPAKRIEQGNVNNQSVNGRNQNLQNAATTQQRSANQIGTQPARNVNTNNVNRSAGPNQVNGNLQQQQQRNDQIRVQQQAAQQSQTQAQQQRQLQNQQVQQRQQQVQQQQAQQRQQQVQQQQVQQQQQIQQQAQQRQQQQVQQQQRQQQAQQQQAQQQRQQQVQQQQRQPVQQQQQVQQRAQPQQRIQAQPQQTEKARGPQAERTM